ncbi:MAG: lysophospholipid acyltransferase (LPLAT)-like uncharacterized protein [Paracoccaceae bacterium]|jgi:lysophospholipid acyltransferase (LPLAT)-like uncharacterized protein
MNDATNAATMKGVVLSPCGATGIPLRGPPTPIWFRSCDPNERVIGRLQRVSIGDSQRVKLGLGSRRTDHSQGDTVKEALKSFLRGRVGSFLISLYLRLVNLTAQHTYEPSDETGRFGADGPVIYATWHGQNFIFAFRFRKGTHPTLLVAHHGDGRMVGQAMRHLGVNLIFGSGRSDKSRPDKGGARAFLQLLKELRGGQSITMTADMPKLAREVGQGIVLLARKSGVPIIPVAMTTSNRKIARSWDKMQVNLPFSKMVFIEGAPIFVPNDETPLAPYQAQVFDALEAAQARAYEVADKS